MPYELKKTNHGYGIQNKSTGKWHSSHATKEKAEAQMRLLNAIDHGWRPSGHKSKVAKRRMKRKMS